MEGGQGLLHGRHLAGQGVVDPGRLAPLVELNLQAGRVGQDELELEHAEVLQGVGAADNVGVLEGPQHQAQGVDLAYPGQEAVAQPLAGGGARHQTGDVDHLDGGVHHLAAVAHVGQGQ